MSHRKHDDPRVTPEELKARKQKLAEGGVIFAIALSLCIYLGIRFAEDPEAGTEPVAVAITQPDTPPSLVVEDRSVGEEAAAAVAPAGTEPAGVADVPEAVQPAVSATRGEAPPIEEVLPEVPLIVTYSLAEGTFLEGRYQEAAGMFATYCGEHPGNAWGHYMHGLALWKSGSLEEAREALDRALELKPDHLKSLVNLARVELDSGRPEAALASVQQALLVAPDNQDARRVLGRAYHALDRRAEAEAGYLEVLRHDADDAWALNNLALLWIEDERFELAVGPLARAVELAPEAAVIRNNLGTALERTGHPAQARAQFATAGELGSERGELSLARLEAVDIPAGEVELDLAAVAAAWTPPRQEEDVATPSSEAVAAVLPEEPEPANER